MYVTASHVAIFVGCFSRSADVNLVADRFPNGPTKPLLGGVYFGYLSGRTDAEGTDLCESRCAARGDCTSYTFVSNNHPSGLWQGECMGRTDGLESDVVDPMTFSGSRFSCTNDSIGKVELVNFQLTVVCMFYVVNSRNDRNLSS